MLHSIEAGEVVPIIDGKTGEVVNRKREVRCLIVSPRNPAKPVVYNTTSTGILHQLSHEEIDIEQLPVVAAWVKTMQPGRARARHELVGYDDNVAAFEAAMRKQKEH